jgi:uncharacterized protein
LTGSELRVSENRVRNILASEEDKSTENGKGGLLGVLLMPIHWIYIVALVLAAGLAAYLFYPWIENFFVFYPSRSLDAMPEAMGLPYRDAYFETENGETLHGWYFPNRNEGPVILFCHGNAGNISHRLDHVNRILAKGLRVFLFDYRGYGKSRGSPSEKGVYLDGVAAYDYLIQREEILPEDIVPYGHSLGAAVAIEIALQKKVRALIIESAFTSVREMASNMALFRLFSGFLPDHYDNLEKLPRARVPVLVMHGESDELVPFSMGEKLYQAARAPRFFYPIKGAAHNDTYVVGGEKYFQTFAMFARHSRI